MELFTKEYRKYDNKYSKWLEYLSIPLSERNNYSEYQYLDLELLDMQKRLVDLFKNSRPNGFDYNSFLHESFSRSNKSGDYAMLEFLIILILSVRPDSDISKLVFKSIDTLLDRYLLSSESKIELEIIEKLLDTLPEETTIDSTVVIKRLCEVGRSHNKFGLVHICVRKAIYHLPKTKESYHYLQKLKNYPIDQIKKEVTMLMKYFNKIGIGSV